MRERRSGRARRDRRGRGQRGPLAPPRVPAVRTRAERFEGLVADAVELVRRRASTDVRHVRISVTDVPPPSVLPVWPHPEVRTVSGDPVVPLSASFPADRVHPPRIVVYRSPIEARARDEDERVALVHACLTGELAELFGHELTFDPEQ